MSEWKEQKEGYREALHYINGRKNGTITSLRTPWKKVDDAGIDGFEWNSFIVIGGRPGSGKTLLKDQIVRECFERNPNEDMRVLEFQFEMIARVSKVREFSAELKENYKYICSASKGLTINDDEIERLKAHSRAKSKLPIDTVEEKKTIDEIEKIIGKYMEKYKKPDGTYTKTLITLDHSYLVKLGKNEKTKVEMLYNLGEVATTIKRKYPVIFIILSQLKREVEAPERNEDGKYGNFILETDIFGGDALVQNADLVFGINKPSKRFITRYGPERFIIEDENTLVFHFLKVRNGDPRMSFFRAVFGEMKIEEMETPPRE